MIRPANNASVLLKPDFGVKRTHGRVLLVRVEARDLFYLFDWSTLGIGSFPDAGQRDRRTCFGGCSNLKKGILRYSTRYPSRVRTRCSWRQK
jgi:hypothetical protein